MMKDQPILVWKFSPPYRTQYLLITGEEFVFFELDSRFPRESFLYDIFNTLPNLKIPREQIIIRCDLKYFKETVYINYCHFVEQYLAGKLETAPLEVLLTHSSETVRHFARMFG